RKQVFAHAVKNRLPTLLVTHDPADAKAAGGDILSL
ncbi:MAG TPA: ABC transporter ATP-binding protein, partial [Deltaproteobacteria bacterium]|nr:ABC transporter ATP-binding protein [Deltaproteobacteria bacterium]